MVSPHNIALLVFDGIQILDVTGPASVFAAANDAAEKVFYQVHILSAEGGTVQSNSAVALTTQALSSLPPRKVDTLLIAGGNKTGLQALIANASVRKWVLQTSALCRRFGSICTGTFALAHFGLINGKRVATHWSACSNLAKLYPDVQVDHNALFVEDGRLWTSAGVTTGIDMSLEMVESDLGNNVANAIAKRLVLYARRPGYQSQFSPVLNAQAHAVPEFSQLILWIGDHLSEPLDVPRLAARVSMSDRSFHRKFTHCMGETPAHFIETLRLDQARHLLSTGASHKQIAASIGYSSPAQLAKAFDRRFGMTPSLFRELHLGGAGKSSIH